MLHYPNWEVPFEQEKQFAAISCQQIGVLRYASQTLLHRNTISTSKRPLLCAAEVFKKYIRTIVRTDCSALQWLKSRDEGARVMRWTMKIDLDNQQRKNNGITMGREVY